MNILLAPFFRASKVELNPLKTKCSEKIEKKIVLILFALSVF